MQQVEFILVLAPKATSLIRIYCNSRFVALGVGAITHQINRVFIFLPNTTFVVEICQSSVTTIKL